MRFKRGAFVSLLPMIPSVLKYGYNNINPTTEPCGFSISILLFCEFALTSVSLSTYAPFIPNDYLFNEYAKTIPDGDKMEKWEVYAYAVRDIIATKGKLIKSTKTGQDNVNYKRFMKGIKDEVSIGNKTFTWPHQTGPCCFTKYKPEVTNEKKQVPEVLPNEE